VGVVEAAPQAAPPGWIDMGLGVPIMNCSRALDLLERRPRRTSTQALLDLLTGIHAGAHVETRAMTAPGWPSPPPNRKLPAIEIGFRPVL
jgi:hypothetical protein